MVYIWCQTYTFYSKGGQSAAFAVCQSSRFSPSNQTILPHFRILPLAELHAEAFRQPSYRFDVESRHGNRTGGYIRNVPGSFPEKLADPLKPLPAERGVAELSVGLGIGGIEAHREGVHQPRQFRQDIPAMNQIGLAVGIDPDAAPLFLQLRGHFPDQVEPEQRFAVAAEDHFIIPRRIADGGKHLRASGSWSSRRWCPLTVKSSNLAQKEQRLEQRLVMFR